MTKKKEKEVEEKLEAVEVKSPEVPLDKKLVALLEAKLEVSHKNLKDILPNKTFKQGVKVGEDFPVELVADSLAAWAKEKGETRDIKVVGFNIGGPGEMTADDMRYFEVTPESLVLTLEHA